MLRYSKHSSQASFINGTFVGKVDAKTHSSRFILTYLFMLVLSLTLHTFSKYHINKIICRTFNYVGKEKVQLVKVLAAQAWEPNLHLRTWCKGMPAIPQWCACNPTLCAYNSTLVCLKSYNGIFTIPQWYIYNGVPTILAPVRWRQQKTWETHGLQN